jgi:hypothetical protein
MLLRSGKSQQQPRAKETKPLHIPQAGSVRSRAKPTLPYWPMNHEQYEAWQDSRKDKDVRLSEGLAGYVYLVGNAELHWYKIGISQSIARRIRNIQTGIPFALTVKHTWNCGAMAYMEGKLLEQFAEHRLYGEWFRFDADIAQCVIEAAETWARLLPRNNRVVLSNEMNPTNNDGQSQADFARLHATLCESQDSAY